MVEGGRELGFADESPTKCLLAGEVRTQDLDGDLAAQPKVLREVDDPHPATPDQRLDPVSGELLPHAEVNGHFPEF